MEKQYRVLCGLVPLPDLAKAAALQGEILPASDFGDYLERYIRRGHVEEVSASDLEPAPEPANELARRSEALTNPVTSATATAAPVKPEGGDDYGDEVIWTTPKLRERAIALGIGPLSPGRKGLITQIRRKEAEVPAPPAPLPPMTNAQYREWKAAQGAESV